jgi:hypothetical protein
VVDHNGPRSSFVEDTYADRSPNVSLLAGELLFAHDSSGFPVLPQFFGARTRVVAAGQGWAPVFPTSAEKSKLGFILHELGPLPSRDGHAFAVKVHQKRTKQICELWLSY